MLRGHSSLEGFAVIDSPQSAKAARFGPFELDLMTGCLMRKGQQERLAVQPARLLILLVQRRGDLVTREDLRLQLWPDDTFGDFDHGLNNAVNRLREALGVSGQPRRDISKRHPGEGTDSSRT